MANRNSFKRLFGFSQSEDNFEEYLNNSTKQKNGSSEEDDQDLEIIQGNNTTMRTHISSFMKARTLKGQGGIDFGNLGSNTTNTNSPSPSSVSSNSSPPINDSPQVTGTPPENENTPLQTEDYHFISNGTPTDSSNPSSLSTTMSSTNSTTIIMMDEKRSGLNQQTLKQKFTNTLKAATNLLVEKESTKDGKDSQQSERDSLMALNPTLHDGDSSLKREKSDDSLIDKHNSISLMSPINFTNSDLENKDIKDNKRSTMDLLEEANNKNSPQQKGDLKNQKKIMMVSKMEGRDQSVAEESQQKHHQVYTSIDYSRYYSKNSSNNYLTDDLDENTENSFQNEFIKTKKTDMANSLKSLKLAQKPFHKKTPTSFTSAQIQQMEKERKDQIILTNNNSNNEENKDPNKETKKDSNDESESEPEGTISMEMIEKMKIERKKEKEAEMKREKERGKVFYENVVKKYLKKLEEVKGTCIQVVTEISNQEDLVKKNVKKQIKIYEEKNQMRLSDIYRKYCVCKLLKLEERRRLELECSKLLTRRIKLCQEAIRFYNDSNYSVRVKKALNDKKKYFDEKKKKENESLKNNSKNKNNNSLMNNNSNSTKLGNVFKKEVNPPMIVEGFFSEINEILFKNKNLRKRWNKIKDLEREESNLQKRFYFYKKIAQKNNNLEGGSLESNLINNNSNKFEIFFKEEIKGKNVVDFYKDYNSLDTLFQDEVEEKFKELLDDKDTVVGKSIKCFLGQIEEFGAENISSKDYLAYIESVCECLFKKSCFNISNDDKESKRIVRQLTQKYIFNLIGVALFKIELKKNYDDDLIYNEKLKMIESLSAVEIGIPLKFLVYKSENEVNENKNDNKNEKNDNKNENNLMKNVKTLNNNFYKAIQTLSCLNFVSNPNDMFHVIRIVSQMIGSEAKYNCCEVNGNKTFDMSADDFFPILVYVIAHGCVWNMFSVLSFLNKYGINYQKEWNESNYLKTCFHSASAYIKEMTLAQLNKLLYDGKAGESKMMLFESNLQNNNQNENYIDENDDQNIFNLINDSLTLCQNILNCKSFINRTPLINLHHNNNTSNSNSTSGNSSNNTSPDSIQN